MLDGILQASTVASAKLKAASNTDSANRFQTVCILHDFSLNGLRHFSSIFTKRNGIDIPAYFLNSLFGKTLLLQKASGIGIIFRMEKLMVIAIM